MSTFTLILIFNIGKHSFNLSTQKNGAASPELIGDFKHDIHSNCSSLVKQQQQSSSRYSNMNNSNCCYDVPARVVLYFLSWSGFLVSFMMRNDVSVNQLNCIVSISLHKVLLLLD